MSDGLRHRVGKDDSRRKRHTFSPSSSRSRSVSRSVSPSPPKVQSRSSREVKSSSSTSSRSQRYQRSPSPENRSARKSSKRSSHHSSENVPRRIKRERPNGSNNNIDEKASSIWTATSKSTPNFQVTSASQVSQSSSSSSSRWNAVSKDPSNGTSEPVKKKRRRWDSAAPTEKAPDSASQARSNAVSRAQQAEKIRQQIQAKLQAINLPDSLAGLSSNLSILAEHRPGFMPAPLILDNEGRAIDKDGNVIEQEKPKPTFVLKSDQEEVENRFHPRAPTGSNKHYDASLSVSQHDPAFGRKKRTFRFVKPGSYVKKAHSVRARILTRNLEQQAAEREIQGGDDRMEDDDSSEEDVNQIQLGSKSAFAEGLFADPIPVIEWWDAELLKEPRYGGKDNVVEMMVTSFVQHPLAVDPAIEQPETPSIPLYLTKKEKKKVVRMRKKEKQDMKTDRLRLGLDEAPEPRVKLSNLMRVLGTSAVADPSAVEKKVRAQNEKRRMTHLLHNESRKLNPQERRAKKRAKLQEDTSNGVHVAVFRIGDLSNSQHRFKIDCHATQWNLTGCALLCGRHNVVVVEGGPKGLKKYIHLMVGGRIKWNSDLDGDESSDDESRHSAGRNQCHLVWKGLVLKNTFSSFSVEQCKSEKLAQAYFTNRGVPQYWDLCKNFVP
uniref:U4/U6 small nuclear ribonucleoprotein Prp3-like isoform X1 n=1 Tax=Hirondellea gigas TaxID=1518452 RepID=A0A6A7G7W8_9CRUS